jgi:hypothetical protein
MAAFVTIPERQFAFTVLTNANRGSELHSLVGQWILANVAGVTSEPPPLMDVPADKLAEFAGRYGNRDQFLDLKLEDGQLALQAITSTPGLSDGALIPPPFDPVDLSFYAEDKAIAFDSPYGGARGEFLRNPAGEIEWFRWGGRINPRVNNEA